MSKSVYTVGILVATTFFLQAGGCKKSERPDDLGKMTVVIVAARDMPVGTTIGYDNVAKMKIPENFVTGSVIQPGGFEKVLGKKVAVVLSRGDMFLWRYFQAEKPDKLSRTIPKKHRVVTVPIRGAEKIKPRDMVDILATLENPGTGEMQSIYLMQNVQVVKPGSDRVTLQVLPEEAQLLVYVSKTAEMFLAVRNPEDVLSHEEVKGITPAVLLETKKGGKP